MDETLSGRQLAQVFRLLDARLTRNEAPSVGIVVCGGAALIVTGLSSRTTIDVDVVALMDDSRKLVAPVPLPEWSLEAALEVSETMGLPEDWLNNGPSRDEGGLFQMGLPDGFQGRLHAREYGERLTVYFVDRIDQIHFKLHAAVDRGGYHVSDLESLRPSDDELSHTAGWTLTHDVSPGFRASLQHLLEALGYGKAASTI